MSHFISFSRYQAKCVIETVDDVINFKIFLKSTYKAMVDREKKRIQTFQYLDSEKSFLDEIKNTFDSF